MALFGPLCPEGHGLLLEKDEWAARGVDWCPNIEHGGNGRFYRLTEIEDGFYDPETRVRSSWQLEQDAKLASREEARKEHEMAKRTAAEKPLTPERTRAPKVIRDCRCGCGGQTKGGTFLPGHDARYHAALRKAGAEIDTAE